MPLKVGHKVVIGSYNGLGQLTKDKAVIVSTFTHNGIKTVHLMPYYKFTHFLWVYYRLGLISWTTALNTKIPVK